MLLRGGLEKKGELFERGFVLQRKAFIEFVFQAGSNESI